MKKEPLISIIMPAYNSEAYIDQALRSVLNQTYANWELLIADDESTDNTVEIILKYSDERINYLGSWKNSGAFATKNKLIAQGKGDYITFLDADDYMSENRLEKQLTEMLANPELGMVGCQINYVTPSGNILRSSAKPLTYDEVLATMGQKNVIGGAIMFVRREVLESVGGGYRAYFGRLSYQDYDLSLLIAERYPCYNLPDNLYYYRQHESSTSKLISVDRYLAKQVVVHLANQRRQRGSDDLMDDNLHLVNHYFDSLRIPFYSDPSKIYREYAAGFMYSKLYRKAIQTAWLAVKKRPWYFVNWRLIQYCIRRSLLKI